MLSNYGAGKDSWRVPWTARRSNQSILKGINPEYSLEGLLAETEAPIVGPPDVKSWFIVKDPDAEKGWRQNEKGAAENETLESITDSMVMNLSSLGDSQASLVAQVVKNLPALQENQVQSLGLEDALEKEMVTHSSILAWKIPWTEEPDGATCYGVTKESSWLSD